MPEFGNITGAAVDLHFADRINQLRYHEQEAKRNQALAASKLAMFDGDANFQNAMNSHDNPIIKQFATNRIKEIGKFARENPDWETNIDKRTQLNLMRQELKSHPDLIRGKTSDSNFSEYNKDLQEVTKSPQQHNLKAYKDVQSQWNNYLQYGNQNGKDAALQEGKKAFIYIKPQNFIELDKNGLERGNKFKGSAMDIQYLKNGRDGAYQTVPKENLLNAETQQFYNDNKTQFDQQYTDKGQNPLTAARQMIMAGIDSKFDIGDKNDLWEKKALAKYEHDLKKSIDTPGASSFKISVLDSDYSKPPSDLLAKTFGSTIPHKIITGNGLIDNTGDIFHYDGEIHDKGYRTDKNYKKTGVKTVHGYVYKPLSWGKESGSTFSPWFGDDEVKKELQPSMSIVDSPIDHDGKTHKVLKVKVDADVNANDPTYQGRWDKEIETTKQRDAFGVNQSMLSQQLFSDDNGNTFILDSNGNAVHYKK